MPGSVKASPVARSVDCRTILNRHDPRLVRTSVSAPSRMIRDRFETIRDADGYSVPTGHAEEFAVILEAFKYHRFCSDQAFLVIPRVPDLVTREENRLKNHCPLRF